MYLFEGDVEVLIHHLDDDTDLAWVVSDGPGRWIARERHSDVPHRACLWHIPSGPLPLWDGSGQTNEWVEDPWRGWQERRAAADPSTAFFGGSHPGVYWLNLNTDPSRLRHGAVIGLSSFEWTGNNYRVIGRPAPPATEAHWKSLRRWVSRVATRVSRPLDPIGKRPEIYAFPAALDAIRAGALRASSP